MSQFITDVTERKTRMTAGEIAAALIDWAIETITATPEELLSAATEHAEDDAPKLLAWRDESPAKLLMWRGATQYARDSMKHVQRLEDLLNGEAQQELFDGFGEFVCIGGEESTFVRRYALSQEEYRTALGLLRSQSDKLIKKIDRYQTDYNTALPFWQPSLTFGQAYRLASETRA